MPARPSVARAFVLLSTGQLASRLLAFAVVVHLGRVLGLEGFGTLVLATGVVGYAALLVELGLDTLGPLEVARGELPQRTLVETVVALRLLLLGLAWLAVGACVALAPVSQAARLAILVYGLALVANVFDLGWVFLGRGHTGVVALAEVANQALQAIGAFTLIHAPEHCLRMPWIFAAARLVSVAGLAWVHRRSCAPLGLGLGLDRLLARRLLQLSLPLAGATAVGAVLAGFDVVLLGLWRGAADAGIYGAALRVAWVPSTIAAAYFTALRPALARASPGGFAEVAPTLRRSLRLAAALGPGLAAGGLVLAEPLVAWLYGSPYATAAAPLRLLLVAVAAVFVSRHHRAVLQAFRRSALDLRIMAACAALNVALNLALVPSAGPLGAATALLASEAAFLVASLWAVRRVVGDASDARAALRALASAALMAALLGATAGLHVLLRVAGGAAAYVVLLLALRGVHREDLLALRPEPRPRASV